MMSGKVIGNRIRSACELGFRVHKCFYSSQSRPKTAILMLNMGGPQNTSQVHDYLYNIMTDTDMIQLPMQSKLGPWIAKRRTPEIQKKYDEIGGGSPILKWTNLQGDKLCKELDKVMPETAPHKHYVGFRYVEPLVDKALADIEADKPDRVVLFSQYPQYCCATSGSSYNSIFTHYRKHKMPSNIKWSVIDRWSTHPLLVKTFADLIKQKLSEFPDNIRNEVIIMFSAHSIPLKTVSRGDSYPSEVGATVEMVMKELNYCNPHSLVWQSKVGPLPWLEPLTDNAIKSFVRQGKKNLLIVPIAFVNEHIETLHELDIEYCHELGEEVGAERILRVPAPNDHPLFIKALVDIVANHLKSDTSVGKKFLMRCPHCVNSRCLESKKWYKQICM